MKISTNTEILDRRFGYEKAVGLIADAGFDAFDLSLFDLGDAECPFSAPDHREYAIRLRQFADSRGIVCNQAHAPFPSSKPRTEENADYNAKIRERIRRSMEIAALVGADQIVVHPIHHLYYPANVAELKRLNREFYTSLLPFCKEYGIRVAVENMFTRDLYRKNVIVESVCARPEEFREYMDMLDPDWFVACLDVGHCGLAGHDPTEFIRALGGRYLHALHVHDNDHNSDLHTLPFQARGVDWEVLTDELAGIGYDGDLTLESESFLRRLPDVLLPDALRLMASTARYLADRITEKTVR